MTTVLVVAAHPDDEVLGCGGTMAGHAQRGDAVHVLFLADGETSRGAGAPAHRNPAAAAAAMALGAREPVLLGLPDNRLDTVPLLDIVKHIEAEVARVRPQVVYTHHGADLNLDHVITHRAVLTACRPLPGTTVEAIHAFEVPSSTEWAPVQQAPAFAPNHFVDIAAVAAAKFRALRCYDGEMRPFPHARSYEAVEALAKWRGASVGVAMAEAFQTVRVLARA